MSKESRVLPSACRSTAVLFVVSSTVLASSVVADIAMQPKSGDPLPGLSASQLERFNIGKERFGIPVSVEEGLGPIFNKAGCFSCHTVPLGGWGSITVTRFGFADKGTFDPLADLGGSLLQVAANSEDCQEFVPPEANVTALRVTNSSLAFGMIEAIDDADILANADPDDNNADGISGKAHMVEAFEDPQGSPLHVGRFGWKAQVATVLTFSSDASQNEMGLSNRFLPFDNAPNGDLDKLAACDTVADPEDGPDAQGYDFIDRVTDFQRYLAPPPQTPKSGMTGEAIFNSIGCNQCHIAQWTTRNDQSIEDAIRGKTIKPYSDFLLHDMGLLGDGIVQGDAGELEMRTPTLWNLRTRDPMLHDGRAAGGTFYDRIAGPAGAIFWHAVVGSEAETSGVAFFNLTTEEQDAVVAFLDSLGRREFDFDGDDKVNEFDLPYMALCFGASGVSPDDVCAIGDVDQDGEITMTDVDAFMTVYAGPLGDCNDNGIEDAVDIIVGTSTDEDGNGIPDECVLCAADLSGDGMVDGADLGQLLAAWGTSGPGDLDGNGDVDGADLGILLGAWGPCRQ
ncbi:MAG: hypothetical protein KDA22_03105 [Phycisphaerales bacterium]|nr:hypothetical protein [Phycisphaerales bacterium]